MQTAEPNGSQVQDPLPAGLALPLDVTEHSLVMKMEAPRPALRYDVGYLRPDGSFMPLLSRGDELPNWLVFKGDARAAALGKTAADILICARETVDRVEQPGLLARLSLSPPTMADAAVELMLRIDQDHLISAEKYSEPPTPVTARQWRELLSDERDRRVRLVSHGRETQAPSVKRALDALRVVGRLPRAETVSGSAETRARVALLQHCQALDALAAALQHAGVDVSRPAPAAARFPGADPEKIRHLAQWFVGDQVLPPPKPSLKPAVPTPPKRDRKLKPPSLGSATPAAPTTAAPATAAPATAAPATAAPAPVSPNVAAVIPSAFLKKLLLPVGGLVMALLVLVPWLFHSRTPAPPLSPPRPAMIVAPPAPQLPVAAAPAVNPPTMTPPQRLFSAMTGTLVAISAPEGCTAPCSSTMTLRSQGSEAVFRLDPSTELYVDTIRQSGLRAITAALNTSVTVHSDVPTSPGAPALALRIYVGSAKSNPAPPPTPNPTPQVLMVQPTSPSAVAPASNSVAPVPGREMASLPPPAPAHPTPEGYPDLEGKITGYYAADLILVEGKSIQLYGIQDMAQNQPQFHAHQLVMGTYIALGSTYAVCYKRPINTYRCYVGDKNLGQEALAAHIATRKGSGP